MGPLEKIAERGDGEKCREQDSPLDNDIDCLVVGGVYGEYQCHDEGQGENLGRILYLVRMVGGHVSQCQVKEKAIQPMQNNIEQLITEDMRSAHLEVKPDGGHKKGAVWKNLGENIRQRTLQKIRLVEHAGHVITDKINIKSIVKGKKDGELEEKKQRSLPSPFGPINSHGQILGNSLG